MKTASSKRRGNSGQVLVITSLIVVMLLLSTVIYVRETGMDAPVYANAANLGFSAVKQAAVHTVISALANISNGGDIGVLAADLNQLRSVIANHSYNAILTMNYTPLNSAPYVDGVWVSWGTSGQGVSGAYVTFALNSSGVSANYYSGYSVNVTSKLLVEGYYTLLDGASKQVNVTCTLHNEDKPALAKNFTIYYEYDGTLTTEEWVQVPVPTIVDYGNGTCFLSFTATTMNRSDPLLISVHYHDTRGILVLANATGTLR